MLLVILGISILLLIIGIIWGTYDCWDNGGTFALVVIGTVILVVALIATVCIGVDVSMANVIDEKIEMYQQENQQIEAQISEIVEQYQQYEGETFEKFKPENITIVATLYPELKSNELVSKQISVYVDNNQKIKELKEQKITASVYRWWLYFGK